MPQVGLISQDDIPNGVSLGRVLFEKMKTYDPKSIAMIDAATSSVLTYGEFLENAMKLSLHYKQCGIEIGDKILIFSENSIHYYTYLLAGWFIGATVCPVNSAFTTYELDNAVKLYEPKLYVCSEKTFPVLQKTVEDLNKESVLFTGKFPNEYNTNHFQPEDVNPSSTVAAIMLSSGTTGLPKGVIMTQDNIIGYINVFKLMETSPDDTTVGVLPYSHIFGVFISLGLMYYHLKTIVMEKFNSKVFLMCIQEYKVTKLYVVPPLVIFLAKSAMVEDYDLSSVTDIFCGAAPLSKGVQNLVQKRLQTVIRQGYGMTECGILAVTPTKNALDKSGSSGSLTSGTVGKIIDPTTHAEIGPYEVGEMCFKTKMLMKGYLKNAEATNAAIDEDGFFHTGDIGYYDEDGFFFIVDRIKELIKYRGFQVAPAELEGILMMHKTVKDAAVFALPDEMDGERPCALIVPEPESDFNKEELLNFVSSMVSSSKQLYGGIEFVDSIPKTSSGKILRKDLFKKYYSIKKST